MDTNSQQQTEVVGTGENLKRVTLLELWKNKKFTAISKLNFNKAHNYPFVTVLNGKKAVNLYFTLKASERIALNSFQKGDCLISNGFLKDAEIVETQSKQEGFEGQTRYKISVPSLESNYSAGAALEQAFGGQNTSEFDIEGFMATFSDSASNAVKASPEVNNA